MLLTQVLPRSFVTFNLIEFFKLSFSLFFFLCYNVDAILLIVYKSILNTLSES